MSVPVLVLVSVLVSVLLSWYVCVCVCVCVCSAAAGVVWILCADALVCDLLGLLVAVDDGLDGAAVAIALLLLAPLLFLCLLS